MASVRKEDIPDIAQFMPEFWEIIKRYWIVEDTDEWWEEVIDTCDALYKKYNNLFVRRMLGAFRDYLEERVISEIRKIETPESIIRNIVREESKRREFDGNIKVPLTVNRNEMLKAIIEK